MDRLIHKTWALWFNPFGVTADSEVLLIFAITRTTIPIDTECLTPNVHCIFLTFRYQYKYQFEPLLPLFLRRVIAIFRLIY